MHAMVLRDKAAGRSVMEAGTLVESTRYARRDMHDSQAATGCSQVPSVEADNRKCYILA